MNRRQRMWGWCVDTARRIDVFVAYLIVAVAAVAGVAALRHVDYHNRSESCQVGRSNDIAIQQGFEQVSSTMERIILAAGVTRQRTDPRAVAIIASLDDLDAKIHSLTIRQCGPRGIITPTNR